MRNKLEFLTNQKGHRWERWDAKDIRHYTWDKYLAERIPTWSWKKYNANQEQQYVWNRYSVHEDTEYRWGKFQRIDQYVTTHYFWDKYSPIAINSYPSWNKEELPTGYTYTWNQYASNPAMMGDKYIKRTVSSQNTYKYVEKISRPTPEGEKDKRAGLLNVPSSIKTLSTGMSSSSSYPFVKCYMYNSSYYTNRPYIMRVNIRVDIRTGDDFSGENVTTIEEIPYFEIGINGLLEKYVDYDEVNDTYGIKSEYRATIAGKPDITYVSRVEQVSNNTSPVDGANYVKYFNTEDYILTKIRTVKNTYPDRDVIVGVNYAAYVFETYRSGYYDIEEEMENDLKGQYGYQGTGSPISMVRAKPDQMGRPTLTVLPHDCGIQDITVLETYFYTDENPTVLSEQIKDTGWADKVDTMQHYLDEGNFMIAVDPVGLSYFQSTGKTGYQTKFNYNNCFYSNTFNKYRPDAPASYTDEEGWTHSWEITSGYVVNPVLLSQKGTVTIEEPGATNDANGNPLIIPDGQTMLTYTYPNGTKIYLTRFHPGGADAVKEGTVSSTDQSAYPTNGEKNGKWYIYDHSVPFLDCSYRIEATFLPSFELDESYVKYTHSPLFNLHTGQWYWGADNTGWSGDFWVSPNELTTFYQEVESGWIKFYSVAITDKNDFTQKNYGEYVGPQLEDSGKYFQQMSNIIKTDYYPNELLEEVTTEQRDSYPDDGMYADYYYIYKTAVDEINRLKGDYIEDVTYLNELHYPIDGVGTDGYWYVYKNSVILKSPEQFQGTVVANDINLYPGNGVFQDFWYTYSHSQVGWVRGRYLETVTATTEDKYPQDGYDGYYWYVFADFTIVVEKTTLVGTADSTDPEGYPQDGAIGNNWYIYTGTYTQIEPTIYIEDVWDADNRNKYPDNGAQGDSWYKYQGYKFIPRYIIGDTILKGGISYKQEVNTSEDYVPGDVACAEIQFTIFTEPKEAQKYLDLECDYYKRMRDVDGWELVGHFTITSAGDKTSTTTKIKGYDNIIKTEKIVDDLINDKSLYPMPLQTLFNRTCEACGLTPIWDNSAINADFSVKHNFTTSNISARQILALVAEVAGGFVKANAEGYIVLQGYKDKGINLTKEEYKDCTKAIYSVQKVNKVNIATSTDDLGVSYGDGEVLYRIIDNPLLRFQNESEITPALYNIYDKIAAVVYVPLDVSVYETFGLECGDIIRVDGEIAYIMSRQWDGSKIKLESKGQRERTVEKNPIDGSIEALRGKSNELKRTIDETNSRITDVEAGLRSEISQTASQIRATIQDTKEGLESQITQTADSLTAEIKNTKEGLESQLQLTTESLNATISNNKEELEGKLSLTAEQFQTQITDTKSELESQITQTADSITSSITSQGNTITEISQRLDGIKLTYNSSNGTASITIGDITVSNLVNGEYVEETMAGIDMTGYVRFNDLERTGATTINGSNITTGQIDADRINLTGAISFSDLNSSLQAQISGGGSGGGTTDPVTGLPDYIKSTYIDATTIYSPRIVGGRLIAGDSSRGYCEMTAGGLNVCASNGSRPIIGLGHLTEHYNEPFITLGIGVDSSGTDAGLIKKYGSGLWIGDTDDKSGTGSTPSRGTGIFINFAQGKVYKYINGTATAL